MGNSVIQINQTKQNFSIEFECWTEDRLVLRGKDSFLNEYLSAELNTAQGERIMRYTANAQEMLKASMPLSQQSMNTGLLQDASGNPIGKFYQNGVSSKKYYVAEYKGTTLDIYTWSTGAGPHLLVYLRDVQIAQIEVAGLVLNDLNTYTLYLLEGYEEYASLLCFSVILYDKYEAGEHGNAFTGVKANSKVEISLTGIGRNKYNPDFLPSKFGVTTAKRITPRDQVRDVKENTFGSVKLKQGLTSLPVCIGLALVLVFLNGFTFIVAPEVFLVMFGISMVLLLLYVAAYIWARRGLR